MFSFLIWGYLLNQASAPLPYCSSLFLVLQNWRTKIGTKFVLVRLSVFFMSGIITRCAVVAGLSQPTGLGSSRFLGGGRWAERVRVQLCSSCVDYIGNHQPADGGPYPTLLFKNFKEIFWSSSTHVIFD